MAAPTIPASSTQAVQTTGGGTTPFTMSWWNFFNSLLAYVSTGPIGPVPLVGVTDGSNAAAGNVGEYQSSLIPSGSGVTLANGGASGSQINSLTLTAGDWDLAATAYFDVSAGSFTFYAAWFTSINSATFPSNSDPTQTFDFGQIFSGGTMTAGGVAEPYTLPGLRLRASVSSSTTFYLFGYASGIVTGPVKGYGTIRARRMR